MTSAYPGLSERRFRPPGQEVPVANPHLGAKNGLGQWRRTSEKIWGAKIRVTWDNLNISQNCHVYVEYDAQPCNFGVHYFQTSCVIKHICVPTSHFWDK